MVAVLGRIFRSEGASALNGFCVFFFFLFLAASFEVSMAMNVHLVCFPWVFLEQRLFLKLCLES